jgi:nucleoside-diphosphate-sugar epimerase
MTHQKYHLVTGASGLLGAELVNQLLKEGKKVKAVYHQHPIASNNNENLYPIQCDLLDVVELEEIMSDVDFVYHCAGFISYSPSNREQLYNINYEATANVVNACLSANIKKLVHVSSVAALGKNIKNKLVDETLQWTNDANGSTYGHSKYLGELEVWRGIAEGLNAVIVSPSIILGAGDWNKGSTAIFKNVFNEFKWYTTGINGFVDVRDVANSMVLLMQSDISNEKFIISAENRTYQDVFNAIAENFKKNKPSKLVTPFIASIVWRLESIKCWFTKKDPLITKETAKAALDHVQYDNSKLLKFLPEFKYQPVENTIAYCCKILQQKVNNQ